MTNQEWLWQLLQNPREACTKPLEEPCEYIRKGYIDLKLALSEQDRPIPVETQEQAILGMAHNKLSLLLGPPGTGKTQVLAWTGTSALIGSKSQGRPFRIFLTAFTRPSIFHLLKSFQALHEKLGLDTPCAWLGILPESEVESGFPAVDGRSAIEFLGQDRCILAGTHWQLQKLLEMGSSPAFDLVCVDEASQLVVAHGLMALAGLGEQGIAIIAGDHQQLPPIREEYQTTSGTRPLGGSLYTFLRDAASEFPLDQTFRMNSTLASFPGERFYEGKFTAAPGNREGRLSLAEGWGDHLSPWITSALDPTKPLTVLLHDGPYATTASKVEAHLAGELAMVIERHHPLGGSETFWSQALAVVTPHRDQVRLLRKSLTVGDVIPSVDTIDRIQGQERDCIILSLTVNDEDFALGEQDFLFNLQRLNVGITRARQKLIILVGRRLLKAAPSELKAFERSEVLRQLIYTTGVDNQVQVSVPGREPVELQIRSKWPDETHGALREVVVPFALSDLHKSIIRIVQNEYPKSQDDGYPGVASWIINKQLGVKTETWKELHELAQEGRLIAIKGKKSVSFKPSEPQQGPMTIGHPDFKRRVLQVARSLGAAKVHPETHESPAKLWKFLNHFVWLGPSGEDQLTPAIKDLALTGEFSIHNDTVCLHEDPSRKQLSSEPKPALQDSDFIVLNTLEDLEERWINFGVFEISGTHYYERRRNLLQALKKTDVDLTADSLDARLTRLHAHGYLFHQQGILASRMAELARELRMVKQRFDPGDTINAPYLVRGIRVRSIARRKPERTEGLKEVLDGALAMHPDINAAVRLTFEKFWGVLPQIAGFQARAIQQVFQAWEAGQEEAFVMTADTGSGKTEAAFIPLLAGAAFDTKAGVKGSRCLFIYPRTRLASNQAQRLAQYLAEFNRHTSKGLSLGLQCKEVPTSPRWIDWERGSGGNGWRFPFFKCPDEDCQQDLTCHIGEGAHGLDRLSCPQCGWTFNHWVATKDRILESPPTFFLPVTESLHQWMQNPKYGRIFGDDPGYSAPRAVVADEIHLYTHVHGAQVGFSLRRLLARIRINGRNPLAIGMSATLSEAPRVWEALSGIQQVRAIGVQQEELKSTPIGREYFFFAQSEVSSRGKDVASMSTTIQAVMCLAHGMRRRPGQEGGTFRTLVFADSRDKVKRLHNNFSDAEHNKQLWSLRTYQYPPHPLTHALRDRCCGNPNGCDCFRSGECWFYAAADPRQSHVKGALSPLEALVVAPRPIYSGTSGSIDKELKGSDILFATASLEVGYDDPEMGLVYQHYSPVNPASFTQRKGRGGRKIDARPITGMTLSPYSSRDTWFFRHPEELLDPRNYRVPLNMANPFVGRVHALGCVLDAVARFIVQRASPMEQSFLPIEGMTHLVPSPKVLASAEQMMAWVFPDEGTALLKMWGVGSLLGLWTQAVDESGATMAKQSKADALEWRELLGIPSTLFLSINLPLIRVNIPPPRGQGPGVADRSNPPEEDITLLMNGFAPGTVSYRFGGAWGEAHWVRPDPNTDGAPWLSAEDYKRGTELVVGGTKIGYTDLRPFLPLRVQREAGPVVCERIFRPKSLTLEEAGRVYFGDYKSDFQWNGGILPAPQSPTGASDRNVRISDKSYGALRWATIIRTEPGSGKPLGTRLPWATARVYTADLRHSRKSGLGVIRITWGADVELKLLNRKKQPREGFFQKFRRVGVPTETLLHGFSLETEGVQFDLDPIKVDRFLAVYLSKISPEVKAHWSARLFRFQVMEGSRAIGLDRSKAHMLGLLIVASRLDPVLRSHLNTLRKAWSLDALKELLLATQNEILCSHPLLPRLRVEKICEYLEPLGCNLQSTLEAAFAAASNPNRLTEFLQSALLHNLAGRLKDAFVLEGCGDEQRVLVHSNLPVLYPGAREFSITVLEMGEGGDGTTRTFEQSWPTFLERLNNNYLQSCPMFEMDELVNRVLNASPEAIYKWRRLDLGRERDRSRLLEAFPSVSDPALFQRIQTLLQDKMNLKSGEVTLLDLSLELKILREQWTSRAMRHPDQWELISALIRTLDSEGTDLPSWRRVGEGYRGADWGHEHDDDDLANQNLIDQALRLLPNHCPDGCLACVGRPSDILASEEEETLVSRSLLDEFLSWTSTG